MPASAPLLFPDEAVRSVNPGHAEAERERLAAELEIMRERRAIEDKEAAGYLLCVCCEHWQRETIRDVPFHGAVCDACLGMLD